MLNVVFEDVIADSTVKMILFWSRLGYPTRSLLLWSQASEILADLALKLALNLAVEARCKLSLLDCWKYTGSLGRF